ncbi:uncharacterized protein N7473_000644 [Penicillium subrubescens]|uniref:uncharacterized protein n=1 Tax=Penicillium subrubescens TaxID=1316194 RepID=UPI00254522FD|nr:uncharacterized protein N7473_000644 [Penicillium subrubescens]KAJ5911341.1 hypothetical protein N7473_000644 [Penicillium subrubescens]
MSSQDYSVNRISFLRVSNFQNAQFCLVLLPLCGLIAANPIADLSKGPDINNPSASDPKTPPKKISFPNVRITPSPRTNADSYAILANCAWWWDTTGYFPGEPGKPGPSSAEDDFPISLWVDLGSTTSPSKADFAKLFSADEEGFDSSTTTTTTHTTTASAPTATADDTCKESYKFFWDHFEIHGKNFDPSKFGKDGSGLKKQIGGCGALSGWHFETDTSGGWQWHAKGNLPIGSKDCVGRAVVSAGGEGPDGCKGSGL